jgi:hypothetical protein
LDVARQRQYTSIVVKGNQSRTAEAGRYNVNHEFNGNVNVHYYAGLNPLVSPFRQI